MKKKIEILILEFLFIICCYQSSYSQNWFEGNPSWRYSYEAVNIIGSTSGSEKLQFKKDTIIQGNLYKVFTNSSSRYNPIAGVDIINEHDEIMYEEDDKIYRYNSTLGTSTKLYDFTLESGDTIKTPLLSDPGSTCYDTLISVIDTILLLDINGYNLRTQYWRNLNHNWDDEFGWTFIIIEKIGAVGNFFFDMTIDWHCYQDASHPFEFGCYLNKDLGIEYGSGFCVELLPIQETENHQKIANIFPNPFDRIVHVQSQKNIEYIRLFDFHGKLKKITYSKNKLDLMNYVSGIYLLQIEYEDGTFEIQKIIKK